MKSFLKLILCVVLLTMLSACGQSGALYLPPADHAQKPTQEMLTAPNKASVNE